MAREAIKSLWHYDCSFLKVKKSNFYFLKTFYNIWLFKNLNEILH